MAPFPGKRVTLIADLRVQLYLASTQEPENPHLVDKAQREPMATAYLALSQPTCLKASGRGLSLSRQKYGIMSVRAADTPK